MQKIHFTIQINAPKEKVWDTMLGDSTYREWTESFHSGSYYKGDWGEGSKMLFLGPDESGKKDGGLVSRIKENRKYEFLSIEHLGLVMDGVEDTESEEAHKWTPAFENYTFTEKDGGTEVNIDMDVLNEEYKEMFEGMWPKALLKLKEITERE
jgi:uncharacterized protein YndB with AHSA1/START domain